MKRMLTFIAMLMPLSTFALDLITDFEWLEPNNKVEIVIGESYQLKFSCSDNSLPFTSNYVDSWVHYDFAGGQHVVSSPTGYSIDNKGVIKGLVAGSYAIKFTGWIQAKSGVDKWLYITVVSEKSEKESNNTLDTANDITTKIRFGLYNISDIDYFKYTNSNLKWGDKVEFKIHYYGSRENPFGYKWATFCDGNMIGSGSLMSQDQMCKATVTSGNTVYLEVYYDQSRSEYFNYGEEFVAEVYINGKSVITTDENDPDESSNIIFADANVKSICVANWDTNHDGELSEAEAAVVTNLGTIFKNNTNITSFDELKYFKGLTGIDKNAFSGCSNLSSIEIPNNVTSIGEYAINRCSSLTSITIPNSVISIGYGAFSSCKGLAEVTIPNSVMSIGESAFQGCSNLTSVTISNSVTLIGGWTFRDCSSLTSVNIGNSVTSIGEGAFYDCSSLVSVTIPNSVTSIGVKAFAGCIDLTSVTIGNSVTTIGEEAFVACSSLKSISVESGNKKYNSHNNCNAIIETASNTLITGCENTVIPNSVTKIGDDAFSGRIGLTSVTIPNGVTSIGNGAFDSCSGLTSITIPNSVTSVGDCAFFCCSGLTEVSIPNSVTSVGEFVFYECSGLTSVTIPNSVTSIGNGAFEGCSSLTSIIIPNSVTSIGNSTFRGCWKLTSVTIPNSVMSIGERAFQDCSVLKSITIPNNVTSIGGNAFDNCVNLTSFTCKAISVPATGNNVFYNVPQSRATLYVLNSTLDSYKNTSPWSRFGSILALPEPTLRGDVNGDGVVNGTDIQAIINLIVESQYDEKADVNEDGQVNGTDIQEVINIIVEGE